MQVSNCNNVNIYDLTGGRSIPEWLSDSKRRRLQQKDGALRRKIQLIQDFEMPDLSNGISMARDGRHLFVTGIYKPFVRCFDVSNLSMKYEHGMDWEVIKFQVISENFSKVVFLQYGRNVEFHYQGSIHFKIRIPKQGRDLAYHSPTCDLFLVGASNEVFRLNLEQGRFLNSYVTGASAINTCKINPAHHLLVCGTAEGRVEAWDPRTRSRVGLLDCALNSIKEDKEITGVPAVTSLCFRDELMLAAGTSMGQILLYDIRSNKPLLVKDHMFGLPIKNVEFVDQVNMVASMDTKILKFWDRISGKAYTSIEPSVNLNDLCIIPNSGLVFMANEKKKILTYYIPSLGPAPQWCSFLDSLTEELEETKTDTAYEDYKFLTLEEVQNLGLEHLIGSSILRAYMHGYFIDVRLFHKIKQMTNPFAFDTYRAKKIKEKIEEDRSNRVKIKALPKVNRTLAGKLMEVENSSSKMGKNARSLLQDDRFKALFEDTDFQVDESAEEYHLLNPFVKMIDAKKKKEAEMMKLTTHFEQVEEGEDCLHNKEEDSSDDEEHVWAEEMKHKRSRNDRRRNQPSQEDTTVKLQPKFYEMKDGKDLKSVRQKARPELSRVSFKKRLEKEKAKDVVKTVEGSKNRVMTFTLKKREKKVDRFQDDSTKAEHHMERKKIRRSAHQVLKKLPSQYQRGFQFQ